MQIRTRTRVAEHGEVFTNPREVNAMLNLVGRETERLESRFLEPACGNGNFLAEILRRKLDVVARRAGTYALEWQYLAFLAVANIYGVELLLDNVEECRARLFKIVETEFRTRFSAELSSNFSAVLHFLFVRNILCGNALLMSQKNADGNVVPLIFSSWAPLGVGRKIKRHDFSFPDLVNCGGNADDLLANSEAFQNDRGEIVSFPRSVCEFPPKHFLKITETAYV